MCRSIVVTLVVICLTASASFSQDYGPIEWDIIGLGIASPSGDDVSAGISISTEPRYNINDKISIGLRGEFAVFSSASGLDSLTSFSVGTSSSWALMGDYYLKNDFNKRAFAGMGLGLFNGADITTTIGTETAVLSGESSIGLIPRIGFELGVLRLTAEYNYAFKSEVSNYLAIKVSLNIGGRSGSKS